MGDQSLESRDRRTSTNNGETYSQSNNPIGASAGISGLSNIDQSVHHYELPNLSQRTHNRCLIRHSVLYDFTNKEHDMIMRCFRIGSCKSMLPLTSNRSIYSRASIQACSKPVAQSCQEAHRAKPRCERALGLAEALWWRPLR